MMKFKITPENAILSVKYCLSIIICWPAPLDATKKTLILRNIAWFVALLFPLHCIPASIYEALHGSSDPVKWTKNLSESICMNITVIKMMIFKYHETRIQVACADMQNFVDTAGKREKEMMFRCIRKCGRFYAFVQVVSMSAATAFSCGPIFLPQRLPGLADFPFEWRDKPKLYAFLYAIEVIAAYQSAAGVIIDMQVALLMWIAGIQFEILAEDYESVSSWKEFCECTERHRKLIASVKEVTIVTRYFAVDVILNTAVTNLCCGLQFVSHQSFEDLLKFVFLFGVSSLELAMYAWPSDNLLTVSENIAWAAYSSSWVGELKVMKGVNIVSVRSQKPLKISLNGLIPEMNLDFYGKFMTTSFSYFTTLRAVVG